jgi:hypothetical protein
VNTGLAILFLGIGGFLLGGAFSLNRQHKPFGAQAVLGVLGVLSATVGALYLW